MPKRQIFTAAIGTVRQSAFIERVHCLTRKESERAANMLWQKYEQRYRSIYVIAWDSMHYELDYDTMNESVVYFRCRDGSWMMHGIATDDD